MLRLLGSQKLISPRVAQVSQECVIHERKGKKRRCYEIYIIFSSKKTFLFCFGQPYQKTTWVSNKPSFTKRVLISLVLLTEVSRTENSNEFHFCNSSISQRLLWSFLSIQSVKRSTLDSGTFCSYWKQRFWSKTWKSRAHGKILYLILGRKRAILNNIYSKYNLRCRVMGFVQILSYIFFLLLINLS